jgi:hypothetical protein
MWEDVTRTVLTDGPPLPRACLRHYTLADADAAAALALLAGAAPGMPFEYSVPVPVLAMMHT